VVVELTYDIISCLLNWLCKNEGSSKSQHSNDSYDSATRTRRQCLYRTTHMHVKAFWWWSVLHETNSCIYCHDECNQLMANAFAQLKQAWQITRSKAWSSCSVSYHGSAVGCQSWKAWVESSHLKIT